MITSQINEEKEMEEMMEDEDMAEMIEEAMEIGKIEGEDEMAELYDQALAEENMDEIYPSGETSTEWDSFESKESLEDDSSSSEEEVEN